ncbi:unnamed protein product [Blepharisma stoltei]|uniref:Uncharacterized protein n=1 Tax=Blepharisma stoltei TaxID=1481888 RepID=A0AAU9K8J9_9CILI|nr:unnamed protein product [Blepharisma stoltei]
MMGNQETQDYDFYSVRKDSQKRQNFFGKLESVKSWLKSMNPFSSASLSTNPSASSSTSTGQMMKSVYDLV